MYNWDKPFEDDSECPTCGESMGKSQELFCSDICSYLYGRRLEMEDDCAV